MADRQPMDTATYFERSVNGPCFVCRMLAGDPEYAHEVVYDDEDHVAFLDRWPVLPGKLLLVRGSTLSMWWPTWMKRRTCG